jgi:hypothetical protein
MSSRAVKAGGKSFAIFAPPLLEWLGGKFWQVFYYWYAR